jgi:uncharacterized protein (DUF433 family)
MVVPLRELENGQLRVGTTRVPLETVIAAFDLGALPEEIVYRYDTLQLPDVYAVLAYVLQHREEVDAYLRRIEHEAKVLRGEIEARYGIPNLRERLLARRAHVEAS